MRLLKRLRTFCSFLAGRGNQEEASRRDAIVLIDEGNILEKEGRNEEAMHHYLSALRLAPNLARAHLNCGNIQLKQGDLEGAVLSYKTAIKHNPEYTGAFYNLGVALKGAGHQEEAAEYFRRAIETKSDFAEAHNHLGNILRELGQLDDAVASFRRALEIRPDYVDVLNNLAVSFKDQGRLVESEAFCRRALEIKPDIAEAYNNLGNAQRELGQLDEAMTSFRRALEIKPDFAEVHSNLALLFIAQGEFILALNSISQSLQIDETMANKSIFVTCVKQLRFGDDAASIRNLLVRALTETWGQSSDLATTCVELVKLNPKIGECVGRVVRSWPHQLSVQDLLKSGDLSAVANDPLLCALIGTTPICDIELERLLTICRRMLLDAASREIPDATVDESLLGFYSALARQCFINEYVFAQTNDEIQKASALRDLLITAIAAKTQVPALWLVAVAAYFPLNALPHAVGLLDNNWPGEVAALLVQQVREPKEELQLRATIPRLTTIEDKVSLLVQNQYEENPYPRWIEMAPVGKAMTIDVSLSKIFPHASFQLIDTYTEPEILIAGCGTGQQSIGTARRFKGARVLAVDLSMTSLSYAKRKTREIKLTSVEYAQADLLKLGTINRSFDVIESTGVLHHLADPWAGWKVLLSLLRPRGLMKLGFYSEVARRNIVRIRNFIADHGYGSTAEDIRRCRQDLMDLDESIGFENTLKIGDFFTISACRDLFFHVQEHRMTLTDIEAFLQENNLAFLGFEIDNEVICNYKRHFPDDHAATNLGQWQIFENENPDTFLRMYQFWIQKVG